MILLFAALVLASTTCVHSDQVFNQNGEKIVTCFTSARTPVKIDIASQFGGVSFHRVCNSLIDPLPISGLALSRVDGTQTIGPVDPTLWTDADCSGVVDTIGGVFVDDYHFSGALEHTVKTIAVDYDAFNDEVIISVVGEGTVPMQLHSGADPFEVGLLLPSTFTGSVGEFDDLDNGCTFILPATPGLEYFKLR